MKYIISSCLFLGFFIFAWCNHIWQPSTNTIPKYISWTQSIIKESTWSLIATQSILTPQKSLMISWHILIYSWLFTITTPTNLPFQKHIIDSQSRYIEKLNLSTDSENRDQKNGYFHFFVEPIADWKKEFSDKDKCIFGNYDENITSKTTLTETKDNKEIYITNVIFSAFDTTWKQWDLCFIDHNLIYTLSVWGYTENYIKNIINSFSLTN